LDGGLWLAEFTKKSKIRRKVRGVGEKKGIYIVGRNREEIR
jgi:hypothetical protein